MVHEVMVLDHSGPELAAIQSASAIKFLVGAAIVATLVEPLGGVDGPLVAATNLALSLGVAVVVGTIESLVAGSSCAPFRSTSSSAVLAGVVALLATAWRADVMTPLLIALLGVLLVPLFVATWRTEPPRPRVPGAAHGLARASARATPRTLAAVWSG